jgi:elongation factor P--beta-lysine ligase
LCSDKEHPLQKGQEQAEQQNFRVFAERLVFYYYGQEIQFVHASNRDVEKYRKSCRQDAGVPF